MSGVRCKKTPGRCSANIPQHGVVAHAKRVLGVVAAGIPRINSSHRAGVRSDDRRERKYTMPVIALACRKGRDHGVAQTLHHASALTAVVQRVLPEGLRQPVARRGADCRDAEVGPKPPAITVCALLPVRRRVAGLIKARCEASADGGIRAKCVEQIVVKFRCLRGTRVGQNWRRRSRCGSCCRSRARKISKSANAWAFAGTDWTAKAAIVNSKPRLIFMTRFSCRSWPVLGSRCSSKRKRTRFVVALAGNLYILGSRILTSQAAVFVARLREAQAG